MVELFKGFEQLVELAKTLEEKLEKGEIKTEVQFNSRPLSNIPRAGGIPRPGGVYRPNNSGGDDFEVNRNRDTPTDSGVEDSVTPPEGPTTASLKDVGGLTEVIKELKELIAIPLKRPDLLAKLGLEPTRGVLLVGPPGTGKTLTARALAEELGVNYIALVGPEVIS
ncbi:MAG: AAA family ATPase, partial [Microcystis sp.]|uniref:AAA family ATPase n=1 Tax=Microcystis sp. TaxID=1127 RepID=UPI00391F1722